MLEALPSGTGRFILISSTGVYGDAGGEWVDEAFALPSHARRRPGPAGRRRCPARPSAGPQGIILRLAGLYGPGDCRWPGFPRLPQLASRRCRQRLVNLIHVDDAAAVVLAAERRAQPPRTYLVADGRPVPRREYLSYLAELAGLPSAAIPRADRGRRRGGAAARRPKRVSNERMLAELGVVLAYPSYREGLAASVGVIRPPTG